MKAENIKTPASVGGLSKAEFVQIYEDTAEVYEGDHARAKFELPDLIPEIMQALSSPLHQADVTNLALTYFFCDLFGRHGRDVEAAWQEATQRTNKAGALELQISPTIQLRIEPPQPELKPCPGSYCQQIISTDLDLCLACRNKPRRTTTI